MLSGFRAPKRKSNLISLSVFADESKKSAEGAGEKAVSERSLEWYVERGGALADEALYSTVTLKKRWCSTSSSFSQYALPACYEVEKFIIDGRYLTEKGVVGIESSCLFDRKELLGGEYLIKNFVTHRPSLLPTLVNYVNEPITFKTKLLCVADRSYRVPYFHVIENIEGRGCLTVLVNKPNGVQFEWIDIDTFPYRIPDNAEKVLWVSNGGATTFYLTLDPVTIEES